MTDLPTTPGGWQVILADPPWRFQSNSAARPGRNALRHYDCMALDDIKAMPVAQIAAKPALLLLWATAPMTPHALEVMAAWGFAYVSQLAWPKGAIGTGFWVRNSHELVLIGKRGAFPAPKPALFSTSTIPGGRRKHSQKPEWVQDQVDARLPEARRIELFGRRQRAGWTVWGNQVERFQPVGGAAA